MSTYIPYAHTDTLHMIYVHMVSSRHYKYTHTHTITISELCIHMCVFLMSIYIPYEHIYTETLIIGKDCVQRVCM